MGGGHGHGEEVKKVPLTFEILLPFPLPLFHCPSSSFPSLMATWRKQWKQNTHTHMQSHKICIIQVKFANSLHTILTCNGFLIFSIVFPICPRQEEKTTFTSMQHKSVEAISSTILSQAEHPVDMKLSSICTLRRKRTKATQ